jgi:hypothetical protein
MNCKHCQNEIEHIDCEQTLSVAVLAHIGSCVSCREFKNEHDSLRLLIGGLEKVAAPASFDARLRARLAHSKTTQPNMFARLNFGLLRPALTFGFALMLLAVGLVFVRPLLTNETKSLNSLSGVSSFDFGELNSNHLGDNKAIVETPSPSPNGGGVSKTSGGITQRGGNSREPKFSSQSASTSAPITNVLPKDFVAYDGTFTVPIRPNARSPFVIVNDKKVPLRSVSFGSPTLVDGRRVKANHVSYTDNVW